MPNPNNGGEWGILGGTFNPVHLGHFALAEDILNARHLDGVLMVPSYIPPVKTHGDLAPFEDRVKMLRVACQAYREIIVNTIESESESPGYTLVTVRALKKRYPKATFHFIIGADLLRELDSWYETDELLKELDFLVGARPGSQLTVPARFDSRRFTLVETRLLDIAARTIRDQIRNGVGRSELIKLVPEPVADYLLERGLYR